MRLRFALPSLLLLCAGFGAAAQSPAAPTCADLHLVPAPRECSAVMSIPLGESGLRVSAEKNAEDDFAARDLEEAFKSRDVHLSEHESSLISLDRAESKAGKELLARHNLKFDPAMHDEGYVIAPDGKGVSLSSPKPPPGLFYGAQTVKQLIRGSGKDAVLLVPTLRDWPAMAHRGISDDWSRGPLPNMDFLKREIRTLAAYKYNILSPYFEATFAYAATPVAAFPGGAMTPDEAREMVDYAAKYHITIIPEQESFGHLHHVLKFEQYSPLGETAHGAVLAPGDPGTLPLISAWFGELAKVFPGPYAHIGADETFELGLGRTRDQVKQQGLGAVYLNFLSQIHSTLAPYHKQSALLGRHRGELAGAGGHAAQRHDCRVHGTTTLSRTLPTNLEPFIKSGLETWVAPGVNNWNRVYPNNNEALGNIRAFVRDGQKLGATGMLNTVWNDDGEGIFDENWFGVLFGAAAGWQPGESSEDAFTASYGLAFHRRRDRQNRPGATRADGGPCSIEEGRSRRRAEDDYFWLDPFSPEGQRISAKLLPVARDLRLHAERAIALLAEARAAGKLENPEALDAMELGARRIDFIGYKFQAAADCASLYSQAQALAADKSPLERSRRDARDHRLKQRPA